jgi:hypothetical protein
LATRRQAALKSGTAAWSRTRNRGAGAASGRAGAFAATLVLPKPISDFPKPGQIGQRNQRKPYDFLVRIAPFQRVTRPPRPFFFPGPFVVNSWCSMKHALPVGVCPGALGLLSGAVMTMSVIALVSIFRKYLFSKNRTAESAFGTDQPLSRLPMRERGTQQNSPFREAPRNRSRPWRRPIRR